MFTGLINLQDLLPVMIGVLVFSGALIFMPRTQGERRDLIAARAQRLVDADQDGGAHGKRQHVPLMQRLRQRFAALPARLRVQLAASRQTGSALTLRLHQAGFRHPNARVIYLIARAGAAVGFAGLAFLYVNAANMLITRPPTAWLIMIGAAVAGAFLPPLLLTNRIQKRHALIERYWQDALDLMIICVESGQSIEASLRRVTVELATEAPVLAEELQITVAEMSIHQDRRRAFTNLAERVDLPSIRAAIIALVQATTQGAPIGNALRGLSASHRDARINAAERKAASLGPKLTLPMIMFFLPVLFVVIIVPIFLKAPA